MTSTEILSNKLRRFEWLSDLVNAAYKVGADAPEVVWRGFALVILSEGPELASPTNEWWPRRINDIRRRLEAGQDVRVVMVSGLRDMLQANDRDGR